MASLSETPAASTLLHLRVPQRSKSVPQPKSELKKGSLLKRRRGKNPKKWSTLKFQKRFLRLTNNSLLYYDNEREKTPNGKFVVGEIVIVEEVRDGEFEVGQHYFQIGNPEEVMYFGAQNVKERKEWMEAFREAARSSKNEMLDYYHPGVYSKSNPGQWSCCNKVEKKDTGCHEASQIDGAYYKCSKIDRPQSTHSSEPSPRSCHKIIDSKGFDEKTVSMPLPGFTDYDTRLEKSFEFDDLKFEMVTSAPAPHVQVTKPMSPDGPIATTTDYVEFHKPSRTAEQPDVLSPNKYSLRSHGTFYCFGA